MRQIYVFEPDFGQEETEAVLMHVVKDQFITAHRHVNRFEKEFAKHVGMKHAIMTNSGSSAVLIAILAMDWKRGDKIITPAVTFGTTLSPLLREGLVPVFIDVEPGTYNVDPNKLGDAMRGFDIKGAVVPHTLGNPVDPDLWCLFDRSVEDACDALDSTVDGQACGTFGLMSAFSFFAAHHISTGHGGMTLTNYPDRAKRAYQFMSWGRDCWCRAGQDSLCGSRFDYQVDGIPYDHKYIFALPGFNLAPMDMQGALGLVQLRKVKKYRETRKRNFGIIDSYVRPLEDLVTAPKSLPSADVNWFSYPVTLKKGDRTDITKRIEDRKVSTRLVFGGNVVRQPMMAGYEHIVPYGLDESDNVMRNSFMVGCNHMITEEEAHHVGKVLSEEIVR